MSDSIWCLHDILVLVQLSMFDNFKLLTSCTHHT